MARVRICRIFPDSLKQVQLRSVAIFISHRQGRYPGKGTIAFNRLIDSNPNPPLEKEKYEMGTVVGGARNTQPNKRQLTSFHTSTKRSQLTR